MNTLKFSKSIYALSLSFFIAINSTTAFGQKQAAVPKTTTTKKASAKAVKPSPKANTIAPAATKTTNTATTAPKITAAPRQESSSSTGTRKTSGSGGAFAPGDGVLNVGLGLGGVYGYGWGSGVTSTPTFSASFEKGLNVEAGPGTIGVGGVVAYKAITWKGNRFGGGGNYKYTWSNAIIAARGAYHYDLFNNDKLDTYAGLMLGVRIVSFSYDGPNNDFITDDSGAEFASGLFIGTRYYFTDNIGAFAEAGYGLGYLNLGVSVKF